jgi:hypothetical protein
MKKTGFSAFLHKAMGAHDIRTSYIAQRPQIAPAQGVHTAQKQAV